MITTSTKIKPISNSIYKPIFKPKSDFDFLLIFLFYTTAILYFLCSTMFFESHKSFSSIPFNCFSEILESFISFTIYNHFGIWLGILTVIVYAVVVIATVGEDNDSIEPFSIQKPYAFVFFLLITQISLLYSFITSNFFIFYSLFEFILIPFYFAVLIWGSRSTKVSASFRLVFFTLIFSFPLTVIIAFNLYNKFFSFNYDMLFSTLSSNDLFIQTVFYIACFIAFAVKIPLFPAHVWLPEAHGEAPTFGSVLLAGVLLKLGGYGFYLVFHEFTNPIWNINVLNFFSITYIVSILTIIYSNLVVFNQLDIKKTIAYYSIGHMGFVSLGLITNNKETTLGAIIIMIGHGISAMGLFMCVGYIYEITSTRSIIAYRGVAGIAPILGFLIFAFVCANVSFPGTLNFIGEQLVMVGLSKISPEFSFLPMIGVFLNGLSSFLFYIRIMFGEFRKTSVSFEDIPVLNEKSSAYALILTIALTIFFTNSRLSWFVETLNKYTI
jgi:NADH-quinone oxidoreductase subunit M